LVITERHGKKYISATSGAITTGALNPPSGSYKQPVSEMIPAGTSIQEVFEILFYKILPKISSVYKGDIIKTTSSGTDQYNDEDMRSGLMPSSVYLRLYVANRQEPVYILLSGYGLVNDEGSSNVKEYVGGSTEFIQVDIQDNVINAYLTDAGIERFNTLDKKIESIQATSVTKTEVQSIVQNEITEMIADIPVMNETEVDDFVNDIF
jgi:hypothetical protein